jgi:hypothetical protein
MRRPKLIGVNRDKRLTVCVRESPPKRSEWGIVPEGVLPERDRGLALRAVALGRALRQAQYKRGLCLGAEKTRSHAKRNA